MAKTQPCTLYKLVRDPKNYADTTNGILYCNDSDNFDECAFMTSSMFCKIWGRKWKELPQEKAMLPVVKITYKGRSIYRRYRQVSAKDFCDFHIGLTQRSISLLCPDENLINKDIEVSVGKQRHFFKNHPDHGTRQAYEMGRTSNKIGTASLVIGIISFVIAIFSILIAIYY